MYQDDAIPEQEDPYLPFEDLHLPGDRIEESHSECEEGKLQALSRSFLSLRSTYVAIWCFKYYLTLTSITI